MSVSPSSTLRPVLMAFILRLHFYLGLFVGPFILLAALSGTLYVLTPQLENRLYSDLLYTHSHGQPQSLEKQIIAAQQQAGSTTPLAAVRPAPAPGHSTRIMFSDAALNPGEHRALFIDPVTLKVLGESTVYGTSGILPLRQKIDYLHSGALFGQAGRYYSELAASWLWVVALGGVALWALRKPAGKPVSKTGKSNPRRRHASLGLVLLPLLLLFSATGLTWSQLAGSNITQLRNALEWRTPALNTSLNNSAPAADDPHAQHRAAAQARGAGSAAAGVIATERPAYFDSVLYQARRNGIEAARVEIRPATRPDQAWVVSEIDRRWPTQVDAVAIDIRNGRIVDHQQFAQFPLVAKLIRWGIDAHMGVLFGVVNQLILALFGGGLCVAIVLGYRMWWRRRPRFAVTPPRTSSLIVLWRQMPGGLRYGLLSLTLIAALLIPLFGIGLALLLLADALIVRRS